MGAKMIFMTLFFVFSTVQGRSAPQEIHDLRYIYTAFSKPSSQPGVYQFTAMGILDDRPIDYYNSKDRIKKPMQKWMEENTDKDYWEKGTQSRRSKEEWFSVNLKILMERMHHNQSDLHILQWMHGCRVEKKPDGSLKLLKGYDNYAYDGADFLSFDSEHKVWVAPVPAADSTKRKWNNEPILRQYTMGYLQNDCVHWLGKFMKHQEEYLRTVPPPNVHIMAKKSKFNPGRYTLVCLATGFYPNDVVVDIYKNGVMLAQWDGVTSSGVRPNGDGEMTFQLEKKMYIEESDTSKYSCRIQHRTLPSPIEEFWDGTCSNCGSDIMAMVRVAAFVITLITFVIYLIAVDLFVKRKALRRSATGEEPHCESEKLSPDGTCSNCVSDTMLIVGGVVAVVILMVLIAVVLFVECRKAHRRSATGEEPHSESEKLSPDGTCSNSDSNIVAIVALVVASVFLMVLIAVVLFVKRWKAHRRSATGEEPRCESVKLSPGAGLAAGEPGKYEKVSQKSSDSGWTLQEEAQMGTRMWANPLVDDAEGEQQPRPEASEVV